MRALIILFLFFLITLGCKPTKQVFNPDFRVLEDSVKVGILKKVNYGKYLGKPVGDLLKNDTVKFFIDYDLIEGKPYALSGVLLSYSDQVTLYVSVYQIRHQPSIRYDGKWNYGLFQKEKISKIVLEYKSLPILTVKKIE